MRRRMMIMLSTIIIVVIVGAIVLTNIKYYEYMRPTEISREEFYVGKGYYIRVDGYEVLDYDEMREKVSDKEQLEAYLKVYGNDSKCVLVSATLKVMDVENMPKDWWTIISLEAQKMWRNVTTMGLIPMLDCNLSKDNYENGKEYKVLFPISINRIQVYDEYYDNAKNWNYRIIWSQNPIVYSNLY